MVKNWKKRIVVFFLATMVAAALSVLTRAEFDKKTEEVITYDGINITVPFRNGDTIKVGKNTNIKQKTFSDIPDGKRLDINMVVSIKVVNDD